MSLKKAHIPAYSWNHGQTCCAGSRIFVHAKIYDQFMEKFVAKAKQIKLGDPFHQETKQGPQVSEAQFDVCSFVSVSCV